MKNDYKNILIVRTDRIGDVVLTIPTISAVRDAYPKARVTFLCAPETVDLIDGNPFLDDILIYDRKQKDRGFKNYWAFIHNLRRKKFDLALVLHTKKRTNVICFLAGIPVRVGYKNAKFGFLLNRPLKDTRAQGTQHEIYYCLDLLKELGAQIREPKFYLPVKKESELWVDAFLKEKNIDTRQQLIAIHPGASCFSRRWPPERFAQLINGIQAKENFKVIVIGGKEIEATMREMDKILQKTPVSAIGRTSISQLISLLKRCQVLISNDSGPMHLASALEIPVIAIFGRDQAGLNPKRWGPLSRHSVVFHKNVGCEVCLAHNCQIDFKCLKAVEPQEVLQAFDSISRLW